jgi:phosphate transport system protein
MLDTTRRDLVGLGALTVDALRSAVKAFSSGDTAMAGRIIADDQMEAQRRKIEAACVELIWRQQPIAGELREVTAIHEIAIDLGIVLGHVNEIAKQAIKVATADVCPDTKEVHQVSTMTEGMLKDALHAFEHRDGKLAESVYARADEVEDHYTPVIESIQSQMQRDPASVACGVALLFEMTALQRIAERAANIAWHTEEMV